MLPSPLREILQEQSAAEQRAIRRARHRTFATLDRGASRGSRRRVALVAAGGLAVAAAVALWFVVSDAPASENAAGDRVAARPDAVVETSPVRRLVPSSGGSIASADAEAGALRLRDGRPAEDLLAEGAPAAADYADGSRIEIGAGGALQVTRNEGDQVHMRLERGTGVVDIVPGGPRRWRFDLGDVIVEVLGTRFTLERSPQRVRVEVERGLVRVSGSAVGAERLLRAGEHFERTWALEAPRAGVRGPAEPTEPTDAWRGLADRGEYARAYELLQTDDFIARAGRETDPGALFAMADSAHLSGHPRDATAPLVRIVEEFPNSERAGLAAFTLGRLYLESLARPADAARAFEQAERLGVPATMREPAAARRMEAWEQAEDEARARTAACDYQRAHPAGSRVAHAAALCERRARPATDLSAPGD